MLPPECASLPERALRAAARLAGREHLARKVCAALYHEVPELAALRNVGRGKRCFIIGNGPSLNKVDVNKMAGEATFGVNGIFLNFEKMSFTPTYYVVEDALVAQDRAPQINQLRGMRKMFARAYRDLLLPDEDTTYMNVIYDYSSYDDFPEFSRNAAKCLWVGGTVTYLNLQLAFHMGYDPVYLVGIDHSYAVKQEKNDVEGKVLTSRDNDENHFHPDYFGKGYRWHDPNVARMEMSYHKARRVFEANGRHVYNATLGGMLEVFERVNYADLF